MKRTMLLSFVLLFAMASQPLHGSSSFEPVVDTSGMNLQANTNYYIIPAKPFTICGFVSCFTGGGIALETIDDDQSCPLDVVVVKYNQGLPLRFTPIVNNRCNKGRVIDVSTDLNIRFSDTVADDDSLRCPNHSTVWRLDNASSKAMTIVTTGGVMGNPGSYTIRNWFKIDKYDDAYKIVYCPSVCPNCKHIVCKDVGIFVDKNRVTHLALTANDPFKVKFQKA